MAIHSHSIPRRKSLRTRLTLVSVAFIVLLGAVLGGYSTYQMRTAQIDKLLDLGRTLTQGIAFNSAFSVYSEDSETYGPLMEGVLREPDVLYVRFSDMQRNQIDEKGKETWAGPGEEKAVLEYLASDIEEHRDAEGNSYYNVRAPLILDRQVPTTAEADFFGFEEAEGAPSAQEAETKIERIPVGYAEVGISPERTQMLIRRTLWYNIGLAALGILLAGVFATFFANRITRPIGTIVQGAVRISEGDLSRGVDVHSDDEVGVLANSFNQMRERIEEQMKSLEAANEEMRRANEQIETARKALWGEMQLAKKIQTVLLPPRVEIPGFDTAASMHTADEVGGDYYDFLQQDGRSWLAIGDVSGHGVTSGLIMMMAESALHSHIMQHPDTDPKTALHAVNRVLCDNTKRMGNDAFMTIVLLAYEGDGRFSYTGAHDDFLLYRAREDRCETVATQGAWVGAFEEIGHALENNTLLLYPDDVLILYSDGVVEAKNVNGELFNMERFKKTLTENASKKAADIHNAVLKEVRKWMHIQDDDITLMVLKREA
ncbi:MAG: SpoIIE family protein phosphatase [Acidobacteriota bacterium]|nr:MAG: SpoIIE family protein phosphatase [Acidobacteriota bacterium]